MEEFLIGAWNDADAFDRVRDAFGPMADVEGNVISDGDLHVFSSREPVEVDGMTVAAIGGVSGEKELEQRIAEVFAEEGIDGFRRINSPFRAVIRDRKDRLHLVNGKQGAGSLFYTRDDDRLLFATALAPLLAAPGIEAEPDVNRMNDFLRNSNTLGGAGRSLIAGIRWLPGSMALTDDGTGHDLRVYWDFYHADRLDVSDREARDRSEELLIEAVEGYLDQVDGDRVNVLFSGGLDSGFAAALLNDLSDRPVHTYTYDFVGKQWPKAQRVANTIGVEPHRLPVELEMPGRETMWYYGSPALSFHHVPPQHLRDAGVSEFFFGGYGGVSFPVGLEHIRSLNRFRPLRPLLRMPGVDRVAEWMYTRNRYASQGIDILRTRSTAEVFTNHWTFPRRVRHGMIAEGHGYEDGADPAYRVMDRRWGMEDRPFDETIPYVYFRGRFQNMRVFYSGMRAFDPFGYPPLAEYSNRLPMSQRKERRLLVQIANDRYPGMVEEAQTSTTEESARNHLRAFVEDDRERYEALIRGLADRRFVDTEQAERFLLPDDLDEIPPVSLFYMLPAAQLELWMQTFIDRDEPWTEPG